MKKVEENNLDGFIETYTKKLEEWNTFVYDIKENNKEVQIFKIKELSKDIYSLEKLVIGENTFNKFYNDINKCLSSFHFNI